MEIHLSLGVSTLVAQMAAHRQDRDQKVRPVVDVWELDHADLREKFAGESWRGANDT